MGEIIVSKAIAPSFGVSLLMVAAAVATARLSGIDGRGLLLAYVFPAAALAFLLLLGWIFVTVVRLARDRSEAPLREVARRLPRKVELLILPVLIAPLFFAAFTTAKAGIWKVTGFRWDRTFADLDAWIFGTDPWRLTHSAFGSSLTEAMAILYTAGWGLGLAIVNVLVAMNGSRRTVGTYFLAMLSCWFVGGFAGAYLLSSAGPVFAHLSDPALGLRFAPLVENLGRLLDADSSVRLTQAYLLSALDSSAVARGGGISAMPSMHIGAAAVVVMASRGTRWIWLALPYLIVTWVGSVHLGYHYAVDGLLVIPIAYLCWKAAQGFYDRAGESELPEPGLRSTCSSSRSARPQSRSLSGDRRKPKISP